MANTHIAGTIAELWRFPVKSMQGERISSAEVTEQGIVGDRAYALIDTQTDTVVSAKRVDHFPSLFACKALFLEPPQPGLELPPVRISLPDGSCFTSDSPDVNDILSVHFGREVTLVQTASGADSPAPAAPFFDAFPLSVITSSTLAQLGELQPLARFDPRRFRMNVIITTGQSGFIENAWVGQQLALGSGTLLEVALPDPRCVMTTLAQDDLPEDVRVLRTINRHNRIQVGDMGLLPCAGVYSVVKTPGTVRIGDSVRLQ